MWVFCRHFQIPGGLFPSPLPPIGKPCDETLSRQTSCQSSLADPWPVLTDKEQSYASTIVSMGFPAPRVARAVQRLGTNDKEVSRQTGSEDWAQATGKNEKNQTEYWKWSYWELGWDSSWFCSHFSFSHSLCLFPFLATWSGTIRQFQQLVSMWIEVCGTVEPGFNEPQYNKILDITNDFI